MTNQQIVDRATKLALVIRTRRATLSSNPTMLLIYNNLMKTSIKRLKDVRFFLDSTDLPNAELSLIEAEKEYNTYV